MAKQYILWLTTAAVFLATSTSAVPVSERNNQPITDTQCGVTCPEQSNAKFQYVPGKTYEYAYESDIKTSVAGTTAEHSSLHMRATVLIDVLSTCKMNLRLIDVTLQDSEPTNYNRRQNVREMAQFKRVMQDKSTLFSFVDGRIESVCPQSDDETWAVNIRRGILSTLQNTMSRLQGLSRDRETDVAGNCPVKYEVTATSGQIFKVKKTKELLACTERQDAQNIFQGMPYNAESDVQSMPLIASTHSCEQEVDTLSRIISKTTCTESHAFRPFAKWNSGATTEVTYKMTFRREMNTNSRPNFNARRVRSSMLYDHTQTAEQTAEALRETQETFKQLCQVTTTDIRPQVPALFMKVVQQMKRLDTASLRQLMSILKGSSMCSKAEKFYRDALPLLGTSGAISTMRQLIRDNQATDVEVDMWMSAMAFIKTPTREMITELKSLVESHMLKAALPVSSLINTYIQLNADGATNADVIQIIKLFEDLLSYNCRSQSDEQTAKMLMALRAIGNAGRGAQSAIPTLTRCANNDASPMSIRVAAVNAFRRIDCNTNNRNALFSLLENRQADSELRINAYLAVMQCANEETITRVQTVLHSDEINQVLSFIWTHLTNLRETASPLKRQIRAVLENSELKKEFDMDKRKFSRNIELSTFSDLLNVGGTVESNLIWSGQSFVPRSASLNFTVDMFGRSINLVEFGGRIQGVEDILEKLMGPGSDIDNAILAGKRGRRAPIRDDVLNTIDRTFDQQPDSDQLSYYVRVFGNEIRAGDIFGFDLESFKSKFNFIDWLAELAKEHNIDVTKSFNFLDTNLIIPTGSGFPLRLSALGSATIGMSANGKVDLRQILSSPSAFDVHGSIKPSTAVEIRASMGVDGRVASTGLKLVNTLHSSTVLDGVLQLRDGRVFNLDWNIPQDKVEIFNAESHVYVTYRDEDREQTNADNQSFKWKKCTCDESAERTGLQMCGELSVPRMGTGALGATIARIYINKLDTYRGLHFDASYVKSTTDDSDSVRVSFNTPGSRTDRELTAEFILRRPQGQVQLKLRTPWKRIQLDGTLVNEEALKRASLRALLDETSEYSITSEFAVTTNGDGKRYSPKLAIVIPNRPAITLDGFVNITPRRYDVKLALKNALRDPITTEGWVQVVEKRSAVKYDVSMQISAPLFKGNLTGYTSQTIEGAQKTWASRAVLQYTYNGGQREQVVVNHKIRDQSASNLKTYSTDCSWTTTLWPRYNGQAGFELSFSDNSVRTKIEAGLDDIRKVTIITSGAHDFVGREKKFNGLVKFTFPYKDWNYEVKVDHTNNKENLQTNATVRYGATGSQQQTASADLALRKESDHPLSLFGEARLRYPGLEVTITETLVERAPREYTNVAAMQFQRGGELRVDRMESTYKMQQRHEITNVITMSGLQYPIRLNGHLLPSPTNTQARVELIYTNKTYLVDGSWTLRSASDQFDARATGTVSLADEGVAITVEASRRENEYTTNVEFLVNGNDMYSINASVTAAKTTPKFQLRADWPGKNFVQLAGNGKYSEGDWNTTPRDLEAMLKLTSSMEAIRDMGILFVHDQTTVGYRTNGELSWAPNKKMSAEVNVETSKAVLTLTTPFTGYQTLKAEFSYSGRTLSGSVAAKLSWDGGKQLALQLTGDASQPSRLITGKVMFTSPFRGFESLVSNFKYNVASDRTTTNADISWARGQQIAVVISMTGQRTDDSMTSNGDMTITTPFEAMRNFRLRWQHQNNPNALKFKYDFDVDSRKFAIDFDISRRLTGTTQRFSGRTGFQCPVLADWLQNASIAFDFQHDLRAVKSVGKLDLIHGRNRLGYEHDVQIDPTSAIIIKTKLTTPFEQVREIGLALNNRRQGNGWTSSNTLIMGSHGRIALEGSYQVNGYALDSTIALTTPYRGLERISATVRNQQQRDGAWLASSELQYATGKQISLTGKLGLQSAQKVIELEIRSPCPHLRQARAAAGYSGSARSFQASMELSHSSFGRDKITATLSSNTADTANMNVQLTVRTPFSDFSSFKVSGRHIRDSRQHTATTANWELNTYRGSALVDLKSRNGDFSDFDARYELEYTAGRKIALATTFKVDPKFAVTATFTSPFEAARTVSASFTQEGPIDNFRIATELTHNGQNRYTSNLDFALQSDSIRTSFRLTTPHKDLERLVISYNLVGSTSKFSLEQIYELNEKVASDTFNYELASGPMLKISRRLEYNYGPVRLMTYSLTHNGPASNFNNNFQLVIDGATTSISSEVRLDGPSMKFQLNSPYPELAEVSFAHTTKPGRTFAGWQNNAALEFNGRRFTGESSMGWRGKELLVSATFNVPEEYSFQMSHKVDANSNYDNVINIRLNDRTIKNTIGVKNTPALIEYKNILETSYPGFDRIEASFRHESSQAGFKTSAVVTTPFRAVPRASAEFTQRFTSKTDFVSTLKVQLPLQSVRQINAVLNHRGTPQDLTSTVTITVDNQSPITSTLSFKNNQRATEGSLVLSTPFEAMSRLNTEFRLVGQNPMSFVLTGKFDYSSTVLPSALTPTTVRLEHSATSRTQFKTIFEVTIPAGKHSATLEHNGDPANFRSSLKVVIPDYIGQSSNMQTYEATLENGIVSGKPKTSITLRNRGDHQLTATKIGTGADLQLSAELNLNRVRGFERTAFSYNHRVNLPTLIEARAVLETSIAGWERTAIGMSHTGGNYENFRSSAYLETSQPDYGRMSTTMSNTKDSTGMQFLFHIETTIPGFAKFAINEALLKKERGGWRWTSTVETPLSGWERWTSSVDFDTLTTGPGFKLALQSTTPISLGQGTYGATLTHSGNSWNNFQTNLKMTLPIQDMALSLTDITLSHRFDSTGFATSFTVDNGNGKKTVMALEMLDSLRATQLGSPLRQASSINGTFKLTTTVCSYFQDLIITASNTERSDMRSGSLVVTANSVKRVDFDFSYKTSGDRTLNFNMRSPSNMNSEVRLNSDNQGTAVVNWNQRQVKFDFGLKNVETSAVTDRYLTFRVTVPHYQRTVGFGAGYTVSSDRASTRLELYWDSDAQPDFLLESEISAKGRTGRDDMSSYDGRLKVTSALFNIDSLFSHKMLLNGKRVKTDIILDRTQRFVIKSDINMASSNGFTSIFTVQHAQFTKDVTLTIEKTLEGIKTTFEYEQQVWTVETNLKREATDDGPKYTSLLRLANPAAMLDVQLVADCMSTDGKLTTGAAFKYYWSRERQLKTLMGFRAELDKYRKEIKLNVESPIESLRLTTSNRGSDLANGIIQYDITWECSQTYRQIVVDYSRRDRTLNMKLYTAADKYIETFAQALSPTQVNFELSHTNANNRVTDVQLTSSFNSDDHLFTGRTYIRPDLSNDVRTYLDQLKTKMAADRTRMTSQVNALVSSMQADGRLKSRSLQTALVTPFNKVATYVSTGFDAKVNQITDAASVMYERNEFFIRDSTEAVQRHTAVVGERIASNTADFRRKYAEWSESVSEQIDAVTDVLTQWNEDLANYMNEYWTQVGQQWQQLQPNLDAMVPFINNMIDLAKTNLMKFFESLRQSTDFKNFADRVAAINPNDYILPPSQWQSRLEAIANKIDRWLEEVLSTPEIHYARDLLIRYMQNSKWMYKMLGLEQQVNEWIAQVRTLNWDVIKMKVRKYVNDYLRLDQTKWTSWDTEQGEFAFQMYIPFELPDYSELARYDPRPMIGQAKEWVADQMPDEDMSLLDIVYAYRMPSDIREWVPPFKSHASLTGAQHYMTFDRRFFEFAGECSYLLARDFIGGTFSVIVNYDRAARNQPIKKSITVITAGRQVEIFPDAKVTVDGTRVEMPVRVGNATVLRQGNLISVIDNFRGLDITCDLPHDHCMLAVSGWYYGKTAGLFGTYDNEPSNDFIQADKAVAERPEVSAETWTVGQRCRPVNRAVVVQPDTTTRRYRACAELFVEGRSSVFRPCFKVVDPASHMTMCLNDASTGDNSLEAQTDVCRSAAAYVHECRRHEVLVRMPKRCVRCEVPTTNRVFFEHESITLENTADIPRAADVVFVVQHAPCNREVLAKIASLADNIEKATKAEGLTSTRFAVVGFGGKMMHLTGPHVHTMEGKIFNEAKKLSLAVDNFNLEADSEVDTMAALTYTARLPFRAGASKSVILIGCDSCRENTVRYSDAQRILLNNDIHLHVLIQDTIRLKSKSPKTAYIYGIDQQTVYTRKDVAGDELAGEPDLRRYIRLPKDLCVALTMDTDGSVFSVLQWLDSRPLVQKQFVDVLVRTLARKAQPTECQVCECLADEANVGISQCHSCYRRDPFYWLPPKFEEEEVEVEPALTDNNSRVTISNMETSRPPATTQTARPTAHVRPTRRPVTRRPVPTRPAPTRPPRRMM